jgi:hypothetical protein
MAAEGSHDGGFKGPTFGGDPEEDYVSWKTQIKLLCRFKRSDDARSTLIVSAIRDKAATALMHSLPEGDITTDQLWAVMDTLFGMEAEAERRMAADKFMRCTQGRKSLRAYALELTKLAAQAGADEATKMDRLRSGVDKRLKPYLLTSATNTYAQSVQYLAALEDSLPPREQTKMPWKEKKNEKSFRTRGAGTEKGKGLAAMTEKERNEWARGKECYNCGKKGHTKMDCRAPKKARGAETKEEAQRAPEHDDAWDTESEN